MGRGAIPSRRGFSRGAMRHPGVSGITRPFGRLSRGRGQVLHVLLSRSPLASLRRGVPFDLHVLGAPPAFILSQDRTLRSDMSMPWGMSYRMYGASVPPFQFSPIWIHVSQRIESTDAVLSIASLTSVFRSLRSQYPVFKVRRAGCVPLGAGCLSARRNFTRLRSPAMRESGASQNVHN